MTVNTLNRILVAKMIENFSSDSKISTDNFEYNYLIYGYKTIDRILEKLKKYEGCLDNYIEISNLYIFNCNGTKAIILRVAKKDTGNLEKALVATYNSVYMLLKNIKVSLMPHYVLYKITDTEYRLAEVETVRYQNGFIYKLHVNGLGEIELNDGTIEKIAKNPIEALLYYKEIY